MDVVPRFTLVAISLALLLWPIQPAEAQPPSSLRVQTVSHGVKLTLIVPRLEYSADALVRPTVTVQNVSRHRVQLYSYPSRACYPYGGGNPEAQALDAGGNVLYPPAILGGPRVLCPPPAPPGGPPQLRPGQVIKHAMYVILRTDRLRARVWVEAQVGPSSYAGLEVVTPDLHITLVPAVASQVTLHTSDGRLSAEIRRPPDAHGLMRYLSFY
jgi:hypothetical protein